MRRIVKLRRKYHHPLIHRAHKNHRISRKTLFYMKEYGPRSNVAATIVKESVKILILASVLSSVGGISLRMVRAELLTVLPLLILLPALNDMIGDFGTIISSKFTTMLYTGKAGERWWQSPDVRKLLKTIGIVALISSVYMGMLAYGIAYVKGFPFSVALLGKVVGISLLATGVLVSIIAFISFTLGIYVYQRNEDPNNFLIPIATAVADVGSMLVFAALVMWMF